MLLAVHIQAFKTELLGGLQSLIRGAGGLHENGINLHACACEEEGKKKGGGIIRLCVDARVCPCLPSCNWSAGRHRVCHFVLISSRPIQPENSLLP